MSKFFINSTNHKMPYFTYVHHNTKALDEFYKKEETLLSIRNQSITLLQIVICLTASVVKTIRLI